MKTNLLSIMMTVASLIFASCSSNDEPEVYDRKVKFSSRISANLAKVGGTDGNQWEGNESIGIYMVGNKTTDVAEGAQNIRYTTTSTGASATFTSTTPIYYPVNILSKVDFIAYHPHDASVSNYIYPINVATQSNQSGIDLMTAFADNTGAGYDKANTSAINLIFKHQLAKIVINVTNGAGIPNLTGLTVSIEGMNTKADFDLKGTAGISNVSEIVAITPFDAGSNNYEAILLPVTLNNTHVVRFTVGGNTYIWTISNNNNNITAFESSKKYTFNVTINKEEVQVTGAIDVWENGGSGTGIGS